MEYNQKQYIPNKYHNLNPGIPNYTRINTQDLELSQLEGMVELLRIRLIKKELKEEYEYLLRKLGE